MENEVFKANRDIALKDLLDKAPAKEDKLLIEVAYEIGYTEALKAALKLVQNGNN